MQGNRARRVKEEGAMEFSETLLGFTVLGGPLILIGFWLYMRALGRRQTLQMVERALDKGTPLDAQLVEALGAAGTSTVPTPERDLRRGIISIALAAAVCVFAIAVDEVELAALACFPGFVGLAYLLLARRRDAAPGA